VLSALKLNMIRLYCSERYSRERFWVSSVLLIILVLVGNFDSGIWIRRCIFLNI
jgi:hypothetical protein